IARAEATLEEAPAAERAWNWMDRRRSARLAALETNDLELDNAGLTRYADLLVADLADWPQTKRGGFEERFDRAVAENYRAVVMHNDGAPDRLRTAVQGYLTADRLFGELEKDFPNDPEVLYRRAWNAYYGYGAAANGGENARAEQLLLQGLDAADRLMS